jgi:hypothetical protein
MAVVLYAGFGAVLGRVAYLIVRAYRERRAERECMRRIAERWTSPERFLDDAKGRDRGGLQ